MKPSHQALELFYRLRLYHLPFRLFAKDRLTVLAYHRVCDPEGPEFNGLEAMVGATPFEFVQQMDFMSRMFHMISIGDLVSWLGGRGTLPPRPALITFDDGYSDNLTHALPVLKVRGIPAIVFLATEYIGAEKPFFWDLIAYCFRHTNRTAAELPLLGFRQWAGRKGRNSVLKALLKAIKLIPDEEKEQIVRSIPDILGVQIRDGTFAGTCLNWDQVRAIQAAGFDVGAHTRSHAILTRISATQARGEIVGSRVHIESEISRPVHAFAYPNGSRLDFNPMLQALCAESGFAAAFTLMQGPSFAREVSRSPMAIRRILVTRAGGLPRFSMKVMGLARLLHER